MKKKLKQKKYEGMGFAEALIALMIAGMVGIVLMRISASTLKELAQLDIQDAIAQHAVSASVDLQKIALDDMTREDKQFDETRVIQNQCYGINSLGTEITPEPIDCDQRSSYTIIPNTDYFRIIKIVLNTPQKAILEIKTGSSKLGGEATTSTDIKDYSYLVTIVK